MNSIAFVIPYFGKFPFWMGFFIESCRSNSTVDFLFYSDIEQPDGWPENIKYQKITFEAYKELVSDKLDVDFDPSNPYKLCDIKPAYGFVHQEDLSGYDFWGFCDIDLVFGNIRNFMTETVLESYEFISAYERRVSGHFFLAKNTGLGRSAFMAAKDWQKVFEDKDNHCFDEKAFSDLFVKFKNHPGWSRKALTWLCLPLSRKALFEEQYSTPGLRYDWINGSRGFPSEWYWQDGVLTNNAAEREFLYFHFLKWKREWGNTVIEGIPKPEPSGRWIISDCGFQVEKSGN